MSGSKIEKKTSSSKTSIQPNNSNNPSPVPATGLQPILVCLSPHVLSNL